MNWTRHELSCDFRVATQSKTEKVKDKQLSCTSDPLPSVTWELRNPIIIPVRPSHTRTQHVFTTLLAPNSVSAEFH